MGTRRYQPADIALWVLSGSVLVVIGYWSITPRPWFPARFRMFNRGDLDIYVYHGVAYMVLAMSLLFSAVWRPGRSSGPAVRGMVVLLAVVGFGVAAEGLQAFVHRDPDFFDALANTVGAMIGYGLWHITRWAYDSLSRGSQIASDSSS